MRKNNNHNYTKEKSLSDILWLVIEVPVIITVFITASKSPDNRKSVIFLFLFALFISFILTKLLELKSVKEVLNPMSEISKPTYIEIFPIFFVLLIKELSTALRIVITMLFMVFPKNIAMSYIIILFLVVLIKSIRVLKTKARRNISEHSVENINHNEEISTVIKQPKSIKDIEISHNNEMEKFTKDTISTKATELGELGEVFTENILFKLAYENKGSKFLKNQLYMLSNEASMQIDGIFIMPNGTLCVIENKSHNGIVSGCENGKQWIVHYGSKSFEMINPVIQNNNHIKNLLGLLKCRGAITSASSLIVFTGDNFKNNTEIENVIAINQLEDRMKALIKKNSEPSETSKLICDVLNDINKSNSSEAYKRHLQYVANVKNSKGIKN